MGEAALEIFLILFLILFNGVLAMSEMALVSSRKVRLQQRADMGDEKARSALEIAQEPSRFLSTVQIGITLVGVLAGAFGGATVAQVIEKGLSKFPLLAPYSQGLSLGLVVVTITYLSLILGELAPKRLALSNPETIASIMARPMQLISRITFPVVRLLNFSTDLVLRVLRVQQSDEPPITEEEIKLLIRQGTHAGILEEAETDMVTAIFRLGDRRIGTIITPRTEIEWLDLVDPLDENLEKVIHSHHSRFPVGKGSLDSIQGVLAAKDLLSCNLTDSSADLTRCVIAPVFVPENMQALKVIEVFRADPQPALVFVIDEFGGLQGLVTANDILEAIVGELPESGTSYEPEIIQRKDGSWLVDGMLPVDEFKDYFQVGDLPEQDRGLYQTLGGFVMSSLGRVPQTGDTFDWKELRFEVADMDGMRVDKVILSVHPAETSDSAK